MTDRYRVIDTSDTGEGEEFSCLVERYDEESGRHLPFIAIQVHTNDVRSAGDGEDGLVVPIARVYSWPDGENYKRTDIDIDPTTRSTS